MQRERTSLVAGNWKMNGLGGSAREVEVLAERLRNAEPRFCEVMICPPATLLRGLAERFQDSAIIWGGQDCHTESAGAHTGDISAEMLADAGAQSVILGHSERRRDHGETDALVRAKAEAAHRASLVSIICVGETERERDSGNTLAVVGRQVRSSVPDKAPAAKLVLAYEPVWAIGTGRTPTLDQIQEVHRFLRGALSERDADLTQVRLLYGGSVKPDNAREIFSLPDVDGGLIGGASLKADDFWGIISACHAVS